MALLSSAGRDNLPDSDFAYIEPGGSKDADGKTTPRSLRHFPIQDAEHVRNALTRISQGDQFGKEALPKVKAAANRFGVDAGTMKALTGPEVKTFAFKMDGPPDDEGKFSGYAAVFGTVDRGNDIIDPGAVTKTLQENPEVPLFWQHDYSVVPIGVGQLAPDPSGKGVRIEGKLFIETSELAREVFGAMKAKAVKGLSIGYNTFKRAFEGKIRRLQEIGIGEVSLCNSPMHPNALVDAVKAFDDPSVDTKAVLSKLETLRDSLDLAAKELHALLEHEPADATQDALGAAEDATEPDVSTLRALIADMRSAA